MPKLEPLKVKDTRPRVYCWHRHGRFVSEWMMRNLGADVSVRTVSHPEELYGLRDSTFVQVTDIDAPNDRSSDSLAAIAVERGFTILSIDDSAPRRIFEAQHGRR